MSDDVQNEQTIGDVNLTLIPKLFDHHLGYFIPDLLFWCVTATYWLYTPYIQIDSLRVNYCNHMNWLRFCMTSGKVGEGICHIKKNLETVK